MITIEEGIKKFNQLAPEIIAEVNHDRVYNEIKNIDNAYDIRISPIVIFAFTGDLKLPEIVKYLMDEYDLSEDQSKKVFFEMQDKIFTPLLERLNFLDANPEKNLNLEKEKNIIIELFNKKLISELENNPVIINAINTRLFYHLDKNINFKEEIGIALLTNEEIVSNNLMYFNDKQTPATVSNWIKDFINNFGSTMFDSVQLSSYITTSSNAKKLNESDRRLLINILYTFRNIKFFPDSMPSDDGVNWEILPLNLDRYENDRNEPNDVNKNNILSEPISKEEGFGKNIQVRPVDTIQPKPRATRSAELQKMSEMYPAGSLERKAIETEIKKINFMQ